MLFYNHLKYHSVKYLLVIISFAIIGFPSAQAQPAFGSLQDLPGRMEGAPMIISNNPESVNREGLILGTMQMSPQDPNTVRRTLSSTDYGQNCPAGSLREFAFYMHHFNQNLGNGARFYVLLEPATAGSSVTFNAYGAAISELDTGSLDAGKSPSYAVGLAILKSPAGLPNTVGTANGSTFVKLFDQTISGVFALVNLRTDNSKSVDARIKVRANGCLTVRVVATRAVNGSVALANSLSKRAYAWGNVPSGQGPGGAPCTDPDNIGWGRPAGIYQYEIWRGGLSVPINSANSSQGWELLLAPPNQQVGSDCRMNPSTTTPSSNSQRSPALGYYYTNTSGASEGRDSDPWSTANYGVEYQLNFAAFNQTAQCVDAKLQLSSYPGQQPCADSAASASRHYDGVFKVTENGTLKPLARVFTKCPAGPRVSTITSKIMQPQELVDWDVQFFIPGLISIPAGILLNTTPVACN